MEEGSLTIRKTNLESKLVISSEKKPYTNFKKLSRRHTDTETALASIPKNFSDG
jgi:hypothetical protein